MHSVRVTDDQGDVARLFEHYDLVATPVVDERDRLVGIITFDDIVDVIEQEAEEEI
jgi:magnesium transporter